MEAETWQWIWLGTAAVFLIGEMATPGSFFMLPFAVGAGGATVAAFAGANAGIQWGIFLGLSVASFLALRPLARRLDLEGTDDGIGAKRLVGASARTVEAVTGDDGIIRVDAEEWRAVSEDGAAIPAGAEVTIIDVRGTRAVVRPR